jgi:formylglycine-generating enzyme required for sulfatase activity
MKAKVKKLFFIMTVVALILAACAPKPVSTPAPAIEPPAVTEPPVTATEALAATATEASTVPESTPTLAPLNLGGPVMEVGSTYPYVDGSTLVAVPGGEFIMGYGNEDNLEHKVTLGDFWIYRNEVTNAQYALCVNLGTCSPPDTTLNINYDKNLRRNDPVTGIVWDQAQAYCEFVNGRLPTEAEWEKTARGPEGNIYPWGAAAASCDLANVGRCKDEITEVTKYPQGASFYGAVDLTGNVFEWVGDWYEAQYYQVSPVENPLGPDTGLYRSVRSTAFRSDFYLAEAARRFHEVPAKPRDDLGFRCVVEDPALFAPWCQRLSIVNPDQSGSGPLDVSIPVPACPDLSITTGGFCNHNFTPPQPGAILDFGTDPLPASTLITFPSGCIPDGGTADPTDYYCSGASGEGSATIKALCTVPPPPVPAGCAPGYTQNGNLCAYTGGLPGDQCLPGINYDPATQCCQAIPGGADSYTLCPVSAPYYAGGVCQVWPIEDWTPLKVVSVGLGTCEKPGGDDGCPLPPPGTTCSYKWDATLCCCVYPNGGCVKP